MMTEDRTVAISTTLFLFIFLPLTLAGYYLIREELRNFLLVAASLIFYALGDPKCVVLLVFSIAVNYALTSRMGRNLTHRDELKGYSMSAKYARRALGWLILTLIFNFALLFVFKYLSFTLQTANTLFRLDIAIPVLALPVGISFYTFRTVSYCLDVYWGTAECQRDPVDLALYVSFFPQVTMGPITKYSQFSSQLHGRRFDLALFGEGAKQMIAGLFKKVVFANGTGFFVDQIFAMADAERTVLLAWVGIIGYLLQLYYDFSGYSDMAIGLGKLFGFTTPKNFDYPYLSRSIVEFWNRWHMTLGTWLRDYLYTPVLRALAGGRKLSMFACNILALLATWIFSGIWHGAGWRFLIYGLYYFSFIAMERTVEYYQKKRRKRLKLKKKKEGLPVIALSHVYCLVVVTFGQLLFRIDSLAAYPPYVLSMFGLAGNGLADGASLYLFRQCLPLMAFGLAFCVPIVPFLEKKLEGLPAVPGVICDAVEWGIYALVFLASTAYVVANSYNAFIYFKF